MKKIFSILLGLAMAYSFSACSDDEYTKKYANPGETSTASCEKLMTGVFYSGAQYTFNGYWRMFTWENAVMGKYAQTIGFTNSPGSIWDVADSYANNRWENFYNVLTQFRVLQDNYNKLSDDDKSTFRVFYCLAEIFVYDHLSQLIDVFGDVPFSEAGYLAITGNVIESYPAYEKAETLYTMMLDNLGTLYTELKGMDGNLNSLAGTYLPVQDYINRGDLTKWMKYCNSLRLRLAIRVASQGTLASKGQQVTKEILDGGHPLLTTSDDVVRVLSDNTDVSFHSSGGFNFSDEFRTGYIDHSRANQAMLNVMLTEDAIGQNDPRLPIMYSKNAAGNYKGYSTRETYEEQVANVSTPHDKESNRIYSRIDSTTVMYNVNFISPIITTAEVDFLKAEAYQKSWANGDAKQSFINGMLHSTQFYFEQNKVSESTYGTKMDIPEINEITSYAEQVWNAAINKEEAIISQKWLNFGYIQSAQAWSDVRRTGYPNLYFPEDPTAQILKSVPNRVMYPASERNYNTANYQTQVQTMGGNDDYYIKLFWAK